MSAITQSFSLPSGFEDVKGWTLIEKLKAKYTMRRSQDKKSTMFPSRSSTISVTPPPSYRGKSRSRASSLISHAPAYEDHTPLTYINAVAFDGGGVRGVASAKVISIIMDDLAAASGRKGPDARAADYFDMIGGTSTGGLIAMMLGRLRVSTDALLDTYLALSARLFSSRSRLLRSVFCGCRYSAALAERLYAQIVMEHTAEGPDALLREGSTDASACNVFVTAVDASDASGRPLLMRSYDVPGISSPNPNTSYRIADAARATTAAPAYFPPATLPNGVVAIDGGIAANNPADLLVAEARRVYGRGVRFGLLLSVGTGEKAPMALPRCTSAASIVSFTRAIGHILTDSKKTHLRVEERFREADLGTYLRINVPEIGDVRLDDYKAVPELMRVTEEYMNTQEMMGVRKEVVRILMRSRNK